MMGDRAGSVTPPAASSSEIDSRMPCSCSVLAFCPRLLVALTSAIRRDSAAGCCCSERLITRLGGRCLARLLGRWDGVATQRAERTATPLQAPLPRAEKASAWCIAAAMSAADSAAQRGWVSEHCHSTFCKCQGEMEGEATCAEHGESGRERARAGWRERDPLDRHKLKWLKRSTFREK